MVPDAAPRRRPREPGSRCDRHARRLGSRTSRRTLLAMLGITREQPFEGHVLLEALTSEDRPPERAR